MQRTTWQGGQQQDTMMGGRPSSYVLSIAGGLQEYSGNYPLDDEIY